jgi:hypothetical protein
MRDENNDQPFVFPAGTTIAANGGYLVVVQDDSKFTAQFPDVLNKTGQMGFSLSGNSDLVRLYDASGRLYLIMQYRDNTPWPTSPDGAGYTLERRDFDQLVHVPEAWQAGCLGGSPGEAFDPSCISVSIDPIPLTEQSMVVWPNPAQDKCWIKMPGTENTLVQLRDAFGRVVQQSTMQNGEGVFSTSHLPRGMYVVSAPETNFPAIKLMLR